MAGKHEHKGTNSITYCTLILVALGTFYLHFIYTEFMFH
uniref:Uncharacterized protein n=1 Tax=Anguilla anguilla TaxID=7936 RepID=A0A0E9XIX6_ANGAN